MSDSIPETAAPRPVLFRFTNQEYTRDLDNLLQMFYEGVFDNRIGIMTSHNLATSEEEIILVGVILDAEGKADCFPIAKCLRAEDVKNYLAPDGIGGYFDPKNPTEVQEAKKNMRSYSEAVVEPSDN